MTLEERIKQMLAESTQTVEVTPEVVAEEVVAEEVVAEEVNPEEELLSLSEEDLDEMTQEEFDAIDEDQLDELSKDTLKSYLEKSHGDFGKNFEQDHYAGKTHKALRSAMAKTNGEQLGTDKQRWKNPLHKDANLQTALKGAADAMDTYRKPFKHKMSVRSKGQGAALSRLKEDSQVSSQVAGLLEAEGLSEEFKLQAVTIFEAAVTDRVLQIQEELEAEYEEKLDEARAELETNIDGFLNEAVQEWADNNQVAIESNFKTRLAESFMDGLQSLLAEHNIDLPADSEDALEIALDEVNKLEEQVSSVDEVIAEMQKEIDTLKAEKILESFKGKMTSTEFDRFVQLTESVKFKDESQYEKQLSIVLENFGKITAKKVEQEEQIVEETVDAPVAQPIVTESFSSVNRYAQYLAKK